MKSFCIPTGTFLIKPYTDPGEWIRLGEKRVVSTPNPNRKRREYHWFKDTEETESNSDLVTTPIGLDCSKLLELRTPLVPNSRI